MNCIIITKTEYEVSKLYQLLNKEYNNIGFWGHPIQDYNADWIWVYSNGELSGTSGYKSLEHTISQCYGFEVHNLKTFENKIIENE